jgi:putative phosphoesterase
MRRIGLISDTHNLLRPGAVAFLQGCDRIIHAGDICNEAVIRALAAIAPVTVVRGNNDRGAWADPLKEVELLAVDEVRVLVVHDLADLKGRPIPDRVRVVVSGHSHKPSINERDGVLYVNPGSAGPRRFKLPISVGELLVEQGRVAARLVEI